MLWKQYTPAQFKIKNKLIFPKDNAPLLQTRNPVLQFTVKLDKQWLWDNIEQ